MNAAVAAMPGSLKTTPRLDRWVCFNAGGSVTVCSGKVELGQGIETALAQIAAEELDVPLDRIELLAGDTMRTPNESYTSGSQSIEVGGSALRTVCAEVRHLFVDAAARRFAVAASELRVENGTIEMPGTDLRTSYWELAPFVDLARDVTGTVAAKPPAEYSCVGTSVARRDLRAKLSGAAYVQDMELPGMVHGRICRPPSYTAKLKRFDAAAVRALPGVVCVMVSGNFIGVCAEREEQVLKALAAARGAAIWEEQAELPSTTEIGQFLLQLPSTRSI
ncbi:MAG: molybdopterin cofactor-binding domain-containing protein, partial [Acidobacteriota bacterium]